MNRAEAEFGPESEEIIEPLMDLGRVLRSASNGTEALDQAFELQSRALEVAEKRLWEANPRFADILLRLAITCEERHAFDQAAEHLTRALRLLRHSGADVDFALVNLIHLLLRAGRPADALPYAAEALALAEQQTGSEGELIGPLIDIGLALRDSGQREEALQALQRAHLLALARPDIPDLREVRKEAEAEIRSWIEDLQGSLGKRT